MLSGPAGARERNLPAARDGRRKPSRCGFPACLDCAYCVSNIYYNVAIVLGASCWEFGAGTKLREVGWHEVCCGG